MIGFDAVHSGRADVLPPAIMTTPTVKWSHSTEGEVEASAVLSPDEKLVFSAGGSEIFALNAQTGRKLWGFQAQSQVLASPALADGALFQGADDNTFYALEQQTGALRWKYDAGGEFTGGAIASNSVVYAGCSKPSLLAWSTAGGLVWEYITTANVASTPAADEQSVYFGDDAGHFHSLNKQTGAIQWTNQLGLNVRAPPAVHANVLYVSTGMPHICMSIIRSTTHLHAQVILMADKLEKFSNCQQNLVKCSGVRAAVQSIPNVTHVGLRRHWCTLCSCWAAAWTPSPEASFGVWIKLMAR